MPKPPSEPHWEPPQRRSDETEKVGEDLRLDRGKEPPLSVSAADRVGDDAVLVGRGAELTGHRVGRHPDTGRDGGTIAEETPLSAAVFKGDGEHG